MSGIMRGYLCERCPLAFEIGGYDIQSLNSIDGYEFWTFDGRREQAVCRACGAMHRLTEENGVCKVTALPGPLRSSPVVKRVDDGYEHEEVVWPAEDEWRPVGEHPGGIDALGRLACARCGAQRQMQSLTFPPHPDGFWVSFRDVCPICGGPMPWLYDSTID